MDNTKNIGNSCNNIKGHLGDRATGACISCGSKMPKGFPYTDEVAGYGSYSDTTIEDRFKIIIGRLFISDLIRDEIPAKRLRLTAEALCKMLIEAIE